MAKILIASPHSDEAELIAFALRFAGHNVTITINGEKAFHLTEDRQVDLILIDAGLQGGYIIDQWQSRNVDQDKPVIPVIVLIEQNQEPSFVDKLKTNNQDIIEKPISLDKLTKKVNRTLKKNRK